MEDTRIFDLYRARDPQAVAESEAAYGAELCRIARNILEDGQNADICVADALARAYETLPAVAPRHLGAYLARLTHALALERYRIYIAPHGGGHHFPVILAELSECIPTGSTGFGSGFDDETESKAVGASVNRFLQKQRGETREIFLCRYFYAESIGEITSRFGLTERQVVKSLVKTREKLKKFLESEGIRL